MSKQPYDYEQEGLPEKIPVQHPYPVIDAAIYQYLEEHKTPFRRVQLTSGSARYILMDTIKERMRPRQLGSFVVRALDSDQTLITDDIPGKENEVGKSYARFIMLSALHIFRLTSHKIKTEIPFDLSAFSTRFSRTEPNRFRAMLRKPTPGSPGKPGRKESSINNWVRQEIQRGRNRQEVLEEYLKKRGIDPTDEAANDKAEDAFRKALSRTKRT